MKKIFFVTLLFFEALQLNRLQAFFEISNDTNFKLHVEAQFTHCIKQKRDLKAKQQKEKIRHTGACINDKIYFVTTDDKGAQRRATLYFNSKYGPVFDPAITTLKNSSGIDYWFTVKGPDWGEYAIEIETPCSKNLRDKLREQGFSITKYSRDIFGTEYIRSGKSGKFYFTEYRASEKDKYQPIKR